VARHVRATHQKGATPDGAHGDKGAIGKVIELTRGEAMKNGISVQTELTEGLPLIETDRVQLQQVTLNLIINSSRHWLKAAKTRAKYWSAPR
jgi:hypothetical protein